MVLFKIYLVFCFSLKKVPSPHVNVCSDLLASLHLEAMFKHNASTTKAIGVVSTIDVFSFSTACCNLLVTLTGVASMQDEQIWRSAGYSWNIKKFSFADTFIIVLQKVAMSFARPIRWTSP